VREIIYLASLIDTYNLCNYLNMQGLSDAENLINNVPKEEIPTDNSIRKTILVVSGIVCAIGFFVSVRIVEEISCF